MFFLVYVPVEFPQIPQAGEAAAHEGEEQQVSLNEMPKQLRQQLADRLHAMAEYLEDESDDDEEAEPASIEPAAEQSEMAAQARHYLERCFNLDTPQ